MRRHRRPDRPRRVSPLGRPGDPELDIGAGVAFLLSDDARYVTGQTFMLDGGGLRSDGLRRVRERRPLLAGGASNWTRWADILRDANRSGTMVSTRGRSTRQVLGRVAEVVVAHEMRRCRELREHEELFGVIGEPENTCTVS